MNKMLLLAGVLAGNLFFIGTAGADVVDADARVSHTVVYPSGARVTRSVVLPLAAGTHTVRFRGVVPEIDPSSISVAGAGTAKVRLFGAGLATVYRETVSDERVRALDEQIQTLDDRMAALAVAAVVRDKKRAYLESVRLFAAGQLPRDLVTKMPSPDELKSSLAFLETETKAVEDASLADDMARRKLAQERQKLMNERAQAGASGRPQAEQVLAVDLECLAPGNLTLDLSYNVGRASWTPFYEARVELDQARAQVSTFAVTRQTSGEDWTDTALTLSTARPSVGGTMPEPSPWYLAPAQAMRRKNRMITGVMEEYEPYYKAADGAAAADAMKSEALQAPVAATVVSAQAVSTGAALVYQAARPVTVKSDGSDARVPLTSQTFPAVFEYAAAPKWSPYAYLRTRLTNGGNDQLLPGRVNIFLDGNFVGASVMAATVPPGAPFDLYLGVDEGVSVKREETERRVDETMIGGIPSPNRKTFYAYKFTVENFKPRPVTLSVFDAVPVPKDDKIRVQDIRYSLKPDTDRFEDRAGVCRWILTLAPKEKKEWTVSFVVEHPRTLPVEGL